MNQIDSMIKVYECNRFIQYRFEFTSSFGLLATYEEHDQERVGSRAKSISSEPFAEKTTRGFR